MPDIIIYKQSATLVSKRKNGTFRKPFWQVVKKKTERELNTIHILLDCENYSAYQSTFQKFVTVIKIPITID